MSDAALAYPKTRYKPAPLVDFSDASVRARLSPAAIRTFFNIVEKWQLDADEARALLGDMGKTSYYELRKALPTADRVLDSDVLQRASYLIGIFKALNIVHSEGLANEWVKLPNRNRIFGGASPLEFMIRGGVPAMQTVRRLLDAQRGGM